MGLGREFDGDRLYSRLQIMDCSLNIGSRKDTRLVSNSVSVICITSLVGRYVDSHAVSFWYRLTVQNLSEHDHTMEVFQT
jgi:hypothetical protein